MKTKFNLILSILPLIIISCNKLESKGTHVKETVFIDSTISSNKKQITNDQLTDKNGKIIHPFEVVHVSATPKQFDSLTQNLDEEDFGILTDDVFYYTGQAQKYLDSVNIKTVNVDAGEKLMFVSKTGKKYPYQTKVVISEFILFDGESEPEIADMVSIDKHIKKLYKKNK